MLFVRIKRDPSVCPFLCNRTHLWLWLWCSKMRLGLPIVDLTHSFLPTRFQRCRTLTRTWCSRRAASRWRTQRWRQRGKWWVAAPPASSFSPSPVSASQPTLHSMIKSETASVSYTMPVLLRTGKGICRLRVSFAFNAGELQVGYAHSEHA